jgi:hypothetical protein
VGFAATHSFAAIHSTDVPVDDDSDGSTILADGLDGAFLEGCQAGGFLFGSGRLMQDIAAATVVIAMEVAGSGLAAEVAIDAGSVDVESAGDILGDFTV